MTKQILLFRLECAIDQTKRDVRRAAQLARKYRAEKQAAISGNDPLWQAKHEVACSLESIYVAERNALVSQLRMLRGIVR